MEVMIRYTDDEGQALSESKMSFGALDIDSIARSERLDQLESDTLDKGHEMGIAGVGMSSSTRTSVLHCSTTAGLGGKGTSSSISNPVTFNLSKDMPAQPDGDAA